MNAHKHVAKKINHKVFVLGIGIIFGLVLALCLLMFTTNSYAIENDAVVDNTNNGVVVSLTGDQWGWDVGGGPALEYDSGLDMYHTTITFEGNYDWKIVKDYSWDVNWGGSIAYSNYKGQTKGERGGPNFEVPYFNEPCDIYLKYINDNNAYIGVNMLPEWDDVFSITGNQWDWDTNSCVDFSYDASEDIYYVYVTFYEISEWKIIKNGSWKVNWGVDSLTYKGNKAIFNGVLDGGNIPTPPDISYTSTIAIKYYSDNEVTVSVNVYPKIDVNLSITGTQWNWDPAGGENFTYDESELAYHARIKFFDTFDDNGWKIVKDHNWNVSFGINSAISYEEDDFSFSVFTYGGNINAPPKTSLWDIYVYYTNDDLVNVHMKKVPVNEISMHSDDGSSTFKYIMDGAEVTSASSKEILPKEESKKLYVNNNYDISGKKTSALIAEDESETIKHTCLFMVDFGFGFNYVDANRIQWNTDEVGLVDEVIVLFQNPPFPVQNVSITCTGDDKVRYYNGQNWNDSDSIDFYASNSGQDITIYDSDVFNEGIVAISDGHDNVVKIKSSVDSVTLNKNKVIYDKDNLIIFIDYTEEYTYSVKVKDSMGTILPQEAIDIDSFADCQYKIEGSKIILTLGTITTEYTAKPVDKNIFKTWLNSSGEEISILEGSLSDLNTNGNVEFVASFVNVVPPEPVPVPPVHDNTDAKTGDSISLLIFVIFIALTGTILYIRRKKA